MLWRHDVLHRQSLSERFRANVSGVAMSCLWLHVVHGSTSIDRCTRGDGFSRVMGLCMTSRSSCAQVPGDGLAWVRGLVPRLGAAMPAAPSRTTPELRAAYNGACAAAWGDNHIVSACILFAPVWMLLFMHVANAAMIRHRISDRVYANRSCHH